jgi:hypothetical protein
MSLPSRRRPRLSQENRNRAAAAATFKDKRAGAPAVWQPQAACVAEAQESHDRAFSDPRYGATPSAATCCEIPAVLRLDPAEYLRRRSDRRRLNEVASAPPGIRAKPVPRSTAFRYVSVSAGESCGEGQGRKWGPARRDGVADQGLSGWYRIGRYFGNHIARLTVSSRPGRIAGDAWPSATARRITAHATACEQSRMRVSSG